MKRKMLLVISAITALLLIFPTSSNAQEEKEKEIEKKIEKRVKIVRVNESGEKTVIDTVFTSDTDLEEMDLGEGMKWIHKNEGEHKVHKTKDGNIIIMSAEDGDKEAFSIYMKDGNKAIGESGEVYKIKKGEKGNYSIITIDEELGDDEKKVNVFISEDMQHSKDGHIIMKKGKSEGHTYIVNVSKDGEKKNVWIEKDEELKDGEVHIVIRSNNEVEDLIIAGDAVITIKDGKVHVNSDAVKMNIKEEGDKKLKKEIKKKK